MRRALAAKKQAGKRAQLVQDKIEEIFDEGRFYTALAEFIVDLPQFPYACIKGPTVRIVPTVRWDQSNTRGVFENQLPEPPHQVPSTPGGAPNGMGGGGVTTFNPPSLAPAGQHRRS